MAAKVEASACKRKRKKPLRSATQEDKKKEKHPKECDYPRYSGQINRESHIWQVFDRTAKLLGEVEAGMDAWFRLSQHHGLMAAPPDGQASICGEHARLIHDDVTKLQALLSTEAKLLMPILLMLVGDKHAAKVMGVELEEEPVEETIH